ncbi:hypothetical protein GCK32_010364, partial [Trichostrongylus colubriformis]
AESVDKQHQPQIEKANDLVQAQVQGKSTAQIQKEKAEMKACAPLAAGEVYSTSFCPQRERVSHFAKPGMEAPTARAADGGPAPGAPSVGAPGKPSAYMYQGKSGVQSTFVAGGAKPGAPAPAPAPVTPPPQSASKPPAAAPPPLKGDAFSVYLMRKG